MSGTFNINQINVNVTDVIPPENFATIDVGAKVGTVYTKEQDNDWRKEVEATTQSGIKGVAKPDTPYDPVTNPIPTPWTTGSPNLYEKYDVNEAGTFPNFKKVNDQAIEVTSQELQLNEVQIWVKNGVAEKHLKAMPQASVNVRTWEDLQPSDFPLTEGNQVVFQNSYFIVKDGNIANQTDTPNFDSNIWEVIGAKSTLESDPINENDWVWGFFSNGNIVAGGNEYVTFKVDNINKDVVKLVLNGNKIDSAYPQSHVAGVKADNTWVDIIPANGGTDNNYTFAHDFSQYVKIYITYFIGGITAPTVKSIKNIDVTLESLYKSINVAGSKINPKLLPTNTAAENGNLLNVAILDAWANRKSIELPSGEFPLENVQWLPVNMTGNDRNTILKSTGANPIFIGHSGMSTDVIDGALLPNSNKKFCGCEQGGFTLFGNNIGTYGMDLGVMAYAKMDRIVMYGFTQSGLRTQGMLVCDWYDLNISHCKNGIIATKGTGFNGATFAANLVTFSAIRMNNISNLGVDWSQGCNVSFYGFDGEACGTGGDANTGVLKFSNIFPDYPGGTGIKLYNSWGERNSGGFFLKIDTNAICVVRDSDILKHGDAEKGLINNGGKLVVDSTKIEGFSPSIETNGANAVTLIQGLSNIANHSEINGGQYRVASFT